MRLIPASTRNPVAFESLEERQLFAAPIPDLPQTEHLTKKDVTNILAAAASQALPSQIISVVDLDGQILGIVAMKDTKPNSNPLDESGKPDPIISTLNKSLGRARTVAFFESHQNAFTTRTARFIIQDHYAPGVPNTPGGPLYGVEFSDLPESDVVSSLPLSGDPGGIPLYKNGQPVGGIGVAGDGSDRRVREGIPYDPHTLPDPNASPDASINLYKDGTEEHDFDEQVAAAGAAKFTTPEVIQATNIFVGGFRFPFQLDSPATAHSPRSLADIVNSGDGSLVLDKTDFLQHTPPYSAQTSKNPRGTPGVPFPAATMGGITGFIKNKIHGSDDTFGVAKGTHAATEIVPDTDRLTKNDVTKVINQAAEEALKLRAGIRLPIGQPVRVHITVVDRDGTILGTFQMQDGTNFSYDIAVQKARTAAFFSDNKHAFTTRTVGFLSQQFFPAGIDDGLTGPLFHLQNGLSLGGTDFGITNRTKNTPGKASNPLADGITVFPGGSPLYKNGQFVGAIGISGDGVDEDNEIAFAGTKHFEAPLPIRADHLPEAKIINFLTNKVHQMQSLYDLAIRQPNGDIIEDVGAEVLARLPLGLNDVQLPYEKFTRNPEL